MKNVKRKIALITTIYNSEIYLIAQELKPIKYYLEYTESRSHDPCWRIRVINPNIVDKTAD